MSDYYKPLTISRKHKDLNWTNCMVSVHDLQCQCDDPLKHIIFQIINQEPSIKFNKKESQIIQKCLTTGEDHAEDGDDEGFGPGDLEELFREDFTEKDTTDTG